MNKEFFEALAMLEKEKGIPMQYLIEKIEAAISIAIKRDENGAEDNVVEINPETGRFYVAVRKTVVEEIEDPANEILKAEAAKYNKTAAVGDIIEIPLETKDFGRIAAQAAKHVIRQGIREAERERIMQEYQSHCNDIITATVLRTDAKTGNVTLELVNKTRGCPAQERAGARRDLCRWSAHPCLCHGRICRRQGPPHEDLPYPGRSGGAPV